MEHDDLNIRKKIMDWENSGSSANTDRLWDTLVLYPAKRSANPTVLYLAAAALVLSGALVVYSLGETQRKAIDLRMMEIELALHKAEAMPAPQVVRLVPEEVPCPMTTETQRPFVTRAKRSPIIQQASLLKKDENPEPQIVVIKEQDPITTTPVETVALTQPSPAPRIILGSHTVAEQSPSKSSRLTLRLFKGDPDQTDVPRSATPMVNLAGINN